MTGTVKKLLMEKEAELRAEIGRLQADLRDVQKARAAILAEAPAKKSETIKEQVLRLLADHPAGLSANEILEKLAARYGRRLKRESLSPQLSRLKKDRLIENEKKIWNLPGITSPLERMRESVAAKQERLPASSIGQKESPAEARLSQTEGAGRSGCRLPIHAPSGSIPDASIQNSNGAIAPAE